MDTIQEPLSSLSSNHCEYIHTPYKRHVLVKNGKNLTLKIFVRLLNVKVKDVNRGDSKFYQLEA